MARAIEKVQAEFAKKSRTRQVEVPEWDLTIHVRPATLETMHQVAGDSEASSAEICAKTLIHRALDEHGQPMFSQAEIDVLMNQSWLSTVTRVVGEINADLTDAMAQEDVQELGEDSGATTQSSGSSS